MSAAVAAGARDRSPRGAQVSAGHARSRTVPGGDVCTGTVIPSRLAAGRGRTASGNLHGVEWPTVELGEIVRSDAHSFGSYNVHRTASRLPQRLMVLRTRDLPDDGRSEVHRHGGRRRRCNLRRWCSGPDPCSCSPGYRRHDRRRPLALHERVVSTLRDLRRPTRAGPSDGSLAGGFVATPAGESSPRRRADLRHPRQRGRPFAAEGGTERPGRR
jgi:hypothetical protein